eukprot:m.10933 g.10933  ORF g.10933 m.10933 type:complete len:502 (+) comp9717_c0_seq5:323-1828(+)
MTTRVENPASTQRSNRNIACLLVLANDNLCKNAATRAFLNPERILSGQVVKQRTNATDDEYFEHAWLVHNTGSVPWPASTHVAIQLTNSDDTISTSIVPKILPHEICKVVIKGRLAPGQHSFQGFIKSAKTGAEFCQGHFDLDIGIGPDAPLETVDDTRVSCFRTLWKRLRRLFSSQSTRALTPISSGLDNGSIIVKRHCVSIRIPSAVPETPLQDSRLTQQTMDAETAASNPRRVARRHHYRSLEEDGLPRLASFDEPEQCQSPLQTRSLRSPDSLSRLKSEGLMDTNNMQAKIQRLPPTDDYEPSYRKQYQQQLAGQQGEQYQLQDLTAKSLRSTSFTCRMTPVQSGTLDSRSTLWSPQAASTTRPPKRSSACLSSSPTRPRTPPRCRFGRCSDFPVYKTRPLRPVQGSSSNCSTTPRKRPAVDTERFTTSQVEVVSKIETHPLAIKPERRHLACFMQEKHGAPQTSQKACSSMLSLGFQRAKIHIDICKNQHFRMIMT